MREYIGNVLSILVIILVMPGCFSKQHKISKAVLPQKQAAFSFDGLETNIDIAAGMADQSNPNLEIEAKLHDIPSMVGSVPVDFESGAQLAEGQIMLAFVCHYDQEMVANFYTFEMENLGWRRVTSIKGFESTLVFQKPKKICIISIRSLSGKFKNQHACLVHICSSSKEK